MHPTHSWSCMPRCDSPLQIFASPQLLNNARKLFVMVPKCLTVLLQACKQQQQQQLEQRGRRKRLVTSARKAVKVHVHPGLISKGCGRGCDRLPTALHACQHRGSWALHGLVACTQTSTVLTPPLCACSTMRGCQTCCSWQPTSPTISCRAWQWQCCWDHLCSAQGRSTACTSRLLCTHWVRQRKNDRMASAPAAVMKQ